MDVGNRHCAVCGKEKERKFIEFAGIFVFIECQCERALREKKEQENFVFAHEMATRLRNKSSHLSPIGQRASFSTMTMDKENERGVKAGKYILDCILKDKTGEPKNSLVLQGNRGSGKTFVASAVINDFNSQYPVSEQRLRSIIREKENSFSENDFSPLKSPCKFINEIDLFALYFDNFNYCKTDSPLGEFKMAQKLLVIDDVGSSEFDRSRIRALYLNILGYRYNNNLPVIITTNLTKKELSEYIGERAFDRLQARSFFVDLTSARSRRVG